MSFDSIGNLGNSSTMKAMLQEEVRLVELAQGTRAVSYTHLTLPTKARLQEEVRLVEFAQRSRVRYANMGVFSAVARNQ